MSLKLHKESISGAVNLGTQGYQVHLTETGDSQGTRVIRIQTHSHAADPTDITSQSTTATDVSILGLNYLDSYRHKKHSTLLFLQPGPPDNDTTASFALIVHVSVMFFVSTMLIDSD